MMGPGGLSPLRVRAGHVEWVAERLSERDQEIIATAARLRVVTGAQLERLHFLDLSPRTRSRVRRRVLQRLTAWRVLASLERRIGGVRAGSAGLVFALDTAGQQLTVSSARNGRRPRQPSVATLGHSLTVSELYVRLVELAPHSGATVTDYQTEPACWWPLPLGGWLKPDAYLKLANADHADHWWIEVDKGTEHLPTIRHKLLTYLDFAENSSLGPGGYLPRVVITVPNEQRRTALLEVVRRLPNQAQDLSRVVTEENAAEYILQVLRT